MVLRLFVPPGEGQHKLVPKRPDPLGANATLQYSLLSSTALAAAYTTFASIHARRVAPAQPASRAALFIRSSARLGLWAGVVGAAFNCYYYSAFTNVVIVQKNPKVKPWKLYKWTKTFTVEDGTLMGAGLGLAMSIPALFMRRLAIPQWTKCLGMTNVGAAGGVLGAHAYLEYTGERQKAYKRLDRRLKRRSLEFWAIFWDKRLMAHFDPVIQQYIRHNGIWYTHHLPDDVYEQPDNYGRKSLKNKGAKAGETEQPQQEEQAYYNQRFDYAEDLKQISFTETHDKMKELEAEREAFLADAEYILFIVAQKEYDYCHWETRDDEDERQRRLQEIQLLEVAYNELRHAALAIEVKLVKWRLSLKHKALWCVDGEDSDLVYTDTVVADWFPTSEKIDFYTHRPTMSLQKLETFQSQIAAEVKRFEELAAHTGYAKAKRERWRLDWEDGRVLLSAADHLVFELERKKKEMEGHEAAKGKEKSGEGAQGKALVVTEKVDTVGGEGEKGPAGSTKKVETAEKEKRSERTQVDKKEKDTKPRDGSLDSDQS